MTGIRLMPDFLLEIGSEEIPARMIDAASRNCANACTELLDRERLLTRECVDLSRHSAPPGGAGARIFRPSQPDVIEEQTGPSVAVAFKDGAAHSCRACLREESRRGGLPAGDASRLRRASTLSATVRRRAAPPLKFWPRRCPKRSPRSTGRRICTGASPANASCARCAGWWPCSTAKSSRSSSTEFAPATSRADIEFWPTDRSRFPVPAPHMSRLWRKPGSSAASREKSRFAKLSTLRLAPFPARAGAKTSHCSTRWST